MKKTILLSVIFFSLITAFRCQAQQPILWGMTSAGVQGGVIFNYNSRTDSETVVHDFGIGTDGVNPIGSLIKAYNGLLYGMTQAGGAVYGGGIIFSYNILQGVETDLHDFNGSDTDGYGAVGSLLQASDSLLYGMVESGGFHDGGIIFSYNISTGKETDLHDFGSDYDGYYPTGSLIQVNDSMLYGMTSAGGLYSLGTIFSFNISTGIESDVHDFGNDSDGYSPNGSLIRAGNGLLYGMTQYGGAVNDSGIIFSFNISNDTEIVLHNFAGGADGASPLGSLLQAKDSLLYGMTQYGGLNDVGIIFSYNIATGTETDLHDFDFGIGTDGYSPNGSLIQASNGLLYGMDILGGYVTGGAIFSYNIATGKEADIYNFGSKPGDGVLPPGDLLEEDVIPVQFDLQCNDRDQHSLYLIVSGMGYYRIDSVDTHPTNLVYLGSDTLNPIGISINKNLDTASVENAMYMCNDNVGYTESQYYYWDNTYWKDTYHTTGNPAAINPGGTNQYIFNLDEADKIIYRYDGTGNGTQLITGLPTISMADIATDMNGNFYLMVLNNERKIIAYNSNGIPVDSFITTGFYGGAGCAILGSRFYVTDEAIPYAHLREGIITGDTINFSVIDSFPSNFLILDLASCPNAANVLAVFKVPEAPHFIIYPNPASDRAIIKMDNTAEIEITDCTGRRIFTADTRGLTEYQLSLARYKPGIYFVTATSMNGLAGHTTLVVE